MSTNNNDVKASALQKAYSLIKSGGPAFWRFVLLVVVSGVITIFALAAWKGCEWQGGNTHLQIKSAPKGGTP